MYTNADFDGKKLFFCVTGCSLLFTEKLMAYGGASAFLKGIYCPYDELSSRELIVGYNLPELYNPEMKMVSNEAVIKMASGCRNYFALLENDVVVTVSASLYKDGQREDRKNHAWMALSCNDERIVEYYDLNKQVPPYQLEYTARLIQEKMLAKQILDFTIAAIKCLGK